MQAHLSWQRSTTNSIIDSVPPKSGPSWFLTHAITTAMKSMAITTLRPCLIIAYKEYISLWAKRLASVQSNRHRSQSIDQGLQTRTTTATTHQIWDRYDSHSRHSRISAITSAFWVRNKNLYQRKTIQRSKS
jgi:hypothetical protein